MNILFIANRFPYPPFRGDKLKIYNLARRLSNRHKLFLITFVQDEEDLKHVKELDKIFTKCIFIRLTKFQSVLNVLLRIFSGSPFQISYFHSGEFHRKLKRFLSQNNIDVVHTQHLRMAQYAADLKSVKRILDLPDAYSMYWNRRYKKAKNLFAKVFAYFEFRKILNYEKILKKFDLNLVCSEEDKEYLKKTQNIDNIAILPNGVDLDFFSMNGTKVIEDKIIFTGNMDYTPNVDAAVYFANEIFPEILKKRPDSKFYIAGQKPVKAVLELQSPNVIVTGFVKDLTAEYESSAVAVSPIRFGAGTLNKVLEPMAVGTPVVMSEVGFKGLSVSSGEGVLLAKNKEEFISHICNLLESKDYRDKIGNKGISVIREKFSWDTIVLQLENYMKRVSNIKSSEKITAETSKSSEYGKSSPVTNKELSRKQKEGKDYKAYAG